MQIGLRIDVDTYRGTRHGVPTLCRMLAARSIKASFFFSVGPDNMGRHLWRMARPTFLWKMLRTQAASLYGWDILLRGTLWPGPIIGDKLPDVIRAAADDGHEAGLHAWDHHAWQAHLDTMSAEAIRTTLSRGFEALARILGRPPNCSAAPGWRCNDRVLLEKDRLPFRYNSDCRGWSIFRPAIGDAVLNQPQIPVTLPTYDELVGRNGVTADTYNDRLLSLLAPDRLNVLTIHAEVEGISCSGMFESFLERARAKGATFIPLGNLLDENPAIGQAAVVSGSVPGREGVLACQSRVRGAIGGANGARSASEGWDAGTFACASGSGTVPPEVSRTCQSPYICQEAKVLSSNSTRAD